MQSLFINQTKQPLIIAETAFGHEGDIDYIFSLIDGLKNQPNVVIKFQILLDKEQYMTQLSPVYKDINKWLLSFEQWESVIEYANKENVGVVLAVLDNNALDLAKKYANTISGVEIHPSCIPDFDFLNRVIEFCKLNNNTLLLGISGFEFEEIDYLFTNQLADFNRENLILIYGFQNYPTRLSSINLNRITLLKERFHTRVGYADHTKYDDVIKDFLCAVAFGTGANVLEIHYVLEYGIERIDYIAAYDKKHIVDLKNKLELLYQAFGKATKNMDVYERDYSYKFRKIPVYSKVLAKGHILEKQDIKFKRSNSNSELRLFDFDSIVGRELKVNVKENDKLTLGELK